MAMHRQQILEGQQEEKDSGQLLGQRPNNPGIEKHLGRPQREAQD
jgi:hypothetical protein